MANLQFQLALTVDLRSGQLLLVIAATIPPEERCNGRQEATGEGIRSVRTESRDATSASVRLDRQGAPEPSRRRGCLDEAVATGTQARRPVQCRKIKLLALRSTIYFRAHAAPGPREPRSPAAPAIGVASNRAMLSSPSLPLTA